MEQMRQKKISIQKIALMILRGLGEAAMRTIDEGFLNPTYPFTHPSRIFLGLHYPGKHRKNEKRRRRSLSIMLYRLKKDGLVKNTGKGLVSRWHITAKGAGFADTYETELREHILPAKDGKVRIVIFDIPEKERKKRDWIRSELIMLDYTMLQKSVWIGKRPLPQSFIKEIKEKEIESYIHIFEAAKNGTL